MDTRPAEPVIIAYGEPSADELRGVIESFVLREGTDYGEREVALEQKVAHVLRQLERGEARIIFDPSSESIDIVQNRGQLPFPRITRSRCRPT